MNLVPFRRKTEVIQREDPYLSMGQWAEMFNQLMNFQGVTYSLGSAYQEEISPAFTSMAQGGYKSNGVVFACMGVRMRLFSEARFQFRQVRNGRPGDLFGTADLAPLETPWPGATTGDLLAKTIQYADLAGNAFLVRQGNQIVPLRPDWVTFVAGSDNDNAHLWDPDVQVIGYRYQPGGPGSGRDPILYDASEVAHFAPIPDPEARFRGMSWLTPVIRELMADKAGMEHKLKFFEHGASMNHVVKLDVADLEKFKQWIELFRNEHEGVQNAYKTLFLGAGADVSVVGADLRQLEFAVTQGHGETRLAAAAGVPPVIVGLSEGLAAATYSNYGMARRAFGDGTMRPLWRNMAGSLARIINVPVGAELWYDDRDITFLQEDRKDADYSKALAASTISSLITSGFEADSAVAAVMSNDFSRLVHTGLFSVQLQPPGAGFTQPSAPSSANGKPAASGANGNGRDDLLLELMRWNEQRLTPELHVTLPELAMPDINVTVQPPEITVPPAEVNITVEQPPAPVVNATIEQPRRPGRKQIEFPDGRVATVTDHGTSREIDFGDGRTALVTETEEE